MWLRLNALTNALEMTAGPIFLWMKQNV